MRRTWLACVLPILLVAVPMVRAGDKAPPPSVVVRVKSLDVLVQNVNLVVKLVGQEEAANQIEGLIKSKIGKNGLEGMDTTRPFGAYVRFGKNLEDVSGAILIPMVDEKTFLTLLDNVGVVYKKDGDGIFTHKTDKNVDVYFRFAHKYLYVTGVHAETIKDKNLPDPATALATTGDPAISIVARVDQIPEAGKLVALTKLQEIIDAAQKKKEPGETKVQEAFRVTLLGDVQKLAAGIVREASEVRLDLDLNNKTEELDVRVHVSAKPKSDLAKTIQAIGDLQSPLAIPASRDIAFQGSVHVALPESLNKAFANVMEEVKENALKSIQDDAKRNDAKTLFDALMPTVKAGEFQAVVAAVGPKDKHYALLSALKLKDGVKLGKTVHTLIEDALKNVPAEQREKYKLDFDSVGPVKIHRFELPDDPGIDKLVADIAGDNQLYLAFRDDALFLALGKGSLPILKTALAKTDAAKSPALRLDIDFARTAAFLAQTDKQKTLATELFPKGDGGRVRLTIEGGTSLNAHLHMQLNALKFLVKLGEKD